MSDADEWQAAFVAVSVAMGEPVDAACAALPGRVNDASRVASVVRGLRSASRGTRAGTLATTLAPVAIAIERTELRWP
jgi:hypothetical protein